MTRRSDYQARAATVAKGAPIGSPVSQGLGGENNAWADSPRGRWTRQPAMARRELSSNYGYERYPEMHHPNGTKAANQMLAAARIRAEAVAIGSEADLRCAERNEARARSKDLPATLQAGAGGELLDTEVPPAPNDRNPLVQAQHATTVALINTVANPDYVTADASRERLELADAAGALGLSLDALDSIQAQDSLERMLVEQMSVLHRAAMKAAAQLEHEQRNGVISGAERDACSIRAARQAGIVARLSSVYQQGLLTFLRKRSGGVQKVQVSYTDQRVNVTEGGQAVIAGHNVQPKGERGRGGRGPKRQGASVRK